MGITSLEDLEKINLQSQVALAFESAIKSSDILLSEPKEVEVLDDGPLPVELKVIESLQKKPASDKDFNPFLNPEGALIVENDFYNDYRLLLNKFPVSENHFLLTTKEFKNQDDLLNPKDLIAIYDILKNVNATKKSNYFAFYNRGPESGFSQTHRHIQFVKYPLKNLKLFPEYTLKGKEFFIPRENDAEHQPLTDESMSFKHFILPLPESFESAEEKEDILSIVYIELFKKILNFFKKLSFKQLEERGEILDNNMNIASVPVSYNLVMNQKFIMVIPRNTATYSKLNIGINAVGFVGLLLAKSEEQKSVILEDGVVEILKECGYPRDLTFSKEDEYDY